MESIGNSIKKPSQESSTKQDPRKASPSLEGSPFPCPEPSGPVCPAGPKRKKHPPLPSAFRHAIYKHKTSGAENIGASKCHRELAHRHPPKRAAQRTATRLHPPPHTPHGRFAPRPTSPAPPRRPTWSPAPAWSGAVPLPGARRPGGPRARLLGWDEEPVSATP